MRFKTFELMIESMLKHKNRYGKISLTPFVKYNDIKFINKNTKKCWSISKNNLLKSMPKSIQDYERSQISKGYVDNTKILQDIINELKE